MTRSIISYNKPTGKITKSRSIISMISKLKRKMLNTLREEVEGFETIWKRLLKTPFYLVDRIGSIILAMYEFTIWPPVTLHIASSSSVYFYFFCC
jgi:hypothetical protein